MEESGSKRIRAGAVAMAAALAAMAGCGEGSANEGAGQVTVRDSAGVTIAEAGELPEAPMGWTVAETPRVVIGGDTEDARAQLVRVAGAVRRSDGRILVGDAGAPALMLFEADGTPVASFGRKGGGPGEFELLTLLGLLPGDSAVAFDQRQGRFTVVGPEMTLGRMFTPGGDESSGLFPETMFGGGPLVMRGRGTEFESPSTGVVDGTSPLLLMATDGTPLDTLGVYPRRSTYLVIGERSINLLRIPFGAQTSYATTGDQLHLGTGGAFEILTFDAAGALTRILRADVPRRAVTPDDLDRFIEDAVVGAPEQAQAGMRTMYRDVPTPEHMPAHGSLVADAAGNLWVEHYRFPTDQPSVWTVFAADGEPLGTVTTPAGVTLLEVGDDYILGSGTDALDLPFVGLWGLERGGG